MNKHRCALAVVVAGLMLGCRSDDDEADSNVNQEETYVDPEPVTDDGTTGDSGASTGEASSTTESESSTGELPTTSSSSSASSADSTEGSSSGSETGDLACEGVNADGSVMDCSVCEMMGASDCDTFVTDTAQASICACTSDDECGCGLVCGTYLLGGEDEIPGICVPPS